MAIMYQKDATAKERVEQMVSRLKDGDHRITPQRLAIFQILASSVGHPSAETIYGALVEHYPTMSLATVYKTLALLKQEGEVLELQFSDLGNRYDGNKPYPHPHVICMDCGEIVDPSLLDLEVITQQMMSETGFKIVAHRLDFFGVCPACQDKS
ncbi:MAG: Fur family peroxide stress response transcriptional regulator [Desulforhopalus sp.]|jgi:Fur family peroxide stress response transcriptional regulator